MPDCYAPIIDKIKPSGKSSRRRRVQLVVAIQGSIEKFFLFKIATKERSLQIKLLIQISRDEKVNLAIFPVRPCILQNLILLPLLPIAAGWLVVVLPLVLGCLLMLFDLDVLRTQIGAHTPPETSTRRCSFGFTSVEQEERLLFAPVPDPPSSVLQFWSRRSRKSQRYVEAADEDTIPRRMGYVHGGRESAAAGGNVAGKIGGGWQAVSTSRQTITRQISVVSELRFARYHHHPGP